LEEWQATKSQAWRLVRDCPYASFGYTAVYYLLAQGELDAALSFMDLIVPQDKPQYLPMTFLLLNYPPDTVSGFIARTKDAKFAGEARIVLVMSLLRAGRLVEAEQAAVYIAEEPNRKLAVLMLLRALVNAGRDDAAKKLATQDALLGAETLEKIIARLQRGQQSARADLQFPAALALAGQFSEAVKLAGDPNARWSNLVEASDRVTAKFRLPQLLTIYVLAEAARAK
jgi:hypothetical protein